jgi:hypothetical protein
MAISQEQLDELSADAFKLASQGKDLLNLGNSTQNQTNDPKQTNNKPVNDEIYRYPLKIIDSRTDHLLIKIFQQKRSSEVFGLPKGTAMYQNLHQFHKQPTNLIQLVLKKIN